MSETLLGRRARSRPGSGRPADRTRRPGLTADEHRHHHRPPGGAPRTAFVLADGISLGAMQAGMVRALYERDIVPRERALPLTDGKQEEQAFEQRVRKRNYTKQL